MTLPHRKLGCLLSPGIVLLCNWGKGYTNEAAAGSLAYMLINSPAPESSLLSRSCNAC